MRVTPYVLLLLTYIIVVGKSDALHRTKFHLFQHPGLFHPGPVYKKFTAQKYLGCIRHCKMDLACVSVNFNRTSSQCTLLGEIREDGELMPDTNTDFYGKYYFHK